MGNKETFSPTIENLGKNCKFWDNRCEFPKAEVSGRTSCEGMVDDVCLFLIRGRKPKSLSEEQITQLKINPPSPRNIPPGDINP